MMLKLSGFEVCKTARSKEINTPIILVTAKVEEIDKVLGLELGVDDYITKPFSIRELLAGIKAILRRTADNNVAANNKQIIGKLEVNFTNYEAYTEGGEVKMTNKEFEVLNYLFNNIGITISRDDILSKVWGIDNDVSTRTIDNFILKLRQKIEENSNTLKIIHTVHGVAYKMVL